MQPLRGLDRIYPETFKFRKASSPGVFMTPGFGMSPLLPGDAGISQTVAKIRQAVHYSLREGSVIARAHSLVGGCPERDKFCEMTTIFNWVLGHYRFLDDPDCIELVKSPEVSNAEIDGSKEKLFQGDCDDVTAYLAALLKAVNIPVRLAVIWVPGEGTEFRHIYPQAWSDQKQDWITMDATARYKPMGWTAYTDRAKYYDV